MKTIKRLLFLMLCVLMSIPILFYGYLKFIYYGDDWKQRTTPLSSGTVEILCKNFELEKDNLLCAGKKEIYAPDFYGTIRDDFQPYEAYNIDRSKSATYDEVEGKIGEFKYECESITTTGDDITFFTCYYDFRGDREFIVGIIYTYPDNAVFRINTPMGYDGE